MKDLVVCLLFGIIFILGCYGHADGTDEDRRAAMIDIQLLAKIDQICQFLLMALHFGITGTIVRLSYILFSCPFPIGSIDIHVRWRPHKIPGHAVLFP